VLVNRLWRCAYDFDCVSIFMAALKRSVDLTSNDIQQAWQDVRDDRANTNWYVMTIVVDLDSIVDCIGYC
jgi:hypothetical protein